MTHSKYTFSPINKLNYSLFTPLNLAISDLQFEPESKEYFAHNFKLGDKKVIFRSAKTTPKKVGLFVSMWKRNDKGITVPYELADSFDLFIITAQNENQFGVFIFSKATLLQQGVLSHQKQVGKRGIRVYPSWVLTNNKQAKKSQEWQSKCFVTFADEGKIDLKEVQLLLA